MPLQMNTQNENDDPQDKTQLTAGGTSVDFEFKKGDMVGGDYQVISFLGAGGMGNVYRVRHKIMQTEYALKTLSAEKVTEVAWLRFQNEAQAIAKMSHPNVVAIYNLGLHDGRLPFYVMDLLDGTALSDRLKLSGPLPVREAIELFVEVCAGIGYAHKKGIVHRDIKPPNIVILSKPEAGGPKIKIVDFGIAKLSYSKEQATQQLTAVGEVCGSPYYMSPEQCAAEKIDARSDIYSIGCSLYETLTGSPPYKGRNAVETMMLHSTSAVPSLQAVNPAKEFPAALEAIVAKTLAKAPMERYQTADQLARDLSSVLEIAQVSQSAPAEPAKERQKPLVLLAGCLAILLIAGAGILAYNGTRQDPAKAPIAGQTAKPLPEAPGTGPGTGMEQSPGPASTPPAIPVTTTSSATSSANSPANSPATSPATKPLVQVINSKGKLLLHFSTPGALYLGEIRAYANTGGKAIKQFQGEFDLPYGFVEFRPEVTSFNHPEYLRQFPENILRGLVLNDKLMEKSENINRLFHAIAGLKGLADLSVSGIDIDDDKLSCIEQLPNLSNLTLDASSISMERLAHSSVLKRLYFLELQEPISSPSPVLKALERSTSLIVLNIPKSVLTDEDYNSISTLSELRILDLDNCAVYDRNLKQLVDKVHLKTLQLKGSHITLSSIPILKKIMMKSEGGWLNIRSDCLKPTDLVQFQHEITGLNVN